MKKYLILFLIFSIPAYYSQSVVINEVMSSNALTLADEDGDFPDWIELYNTSAQSVSLANLSLSDDPKNLTKWNFPNTTILPQNFLIVYASGKDRKAGSMFWETIITKGDLWKYLVPASEPSSTWRFLGFDDAQWKSGASGFGFGDSDDATIVSQTNAIYIRKTFTVTDIGNIDTAFLHVDYDDAFVAYLNGMEIARANIGTKGVPPVYTQTASTNHEAVMYLGGSPDAFRVANIRSLLKVGENVLAMQVHNINATSSDLTLIPFLTLGLKTPVVNPRGLSPLLSLPSSYLHTNFKLDADGETLYLTDSSGGKLDEVSFGFIPTGLSFGRKPDGGTSWLYFQIPTPKTLNSSIGVSQVAEPPQFSRSAGFYYNALSVAITSTLTGGTIYYTTDGSDPVTTSSKYIGAITLSKTTTLRAKVFAAGVVTSPTTTSTYLINHVSTLPVVSLSTDPKHFWDNDSGIYAMGSNPGSYPYFGANFWQDWEKPIHFEFFEPGDSQKVSVDAGVKVFGNWSRAFDQKSLAIYLRGSYGFNKMKYQFFPGKKNENFENIVLRNGGNDFTYTLLRDRYMNTMLQNLDIGVQATRFCVVYLNNEYWGIHTLREKLNEEFLANTYGVDLTNVDIVELNSEAGFHVNEHLSTLYDFISQKDINTKVNYDFVQSQMEIENYKNYQIAEIYINNTDWPGNNMKVWRERTETGKWKWLTYDLDYGVGLAEYIFPQQDYKFNTLDFATATNGPGWPNPPWSTLMFRKLLTNNEFKNDFIQSFAHLLNTTFSPDSTLLLLNKIQDEIAPEITRHTTKWKNTMQYNWTSNISRIRTFISLREAYMRLHLISKFQLGGLSNLTLTVNDSLGGRVSLQSYTIAKTSFTGKYFKTVPIKLSAKPNPGFVFAGWKGFSTNPEINIALTGDSVLQAIFVKDDIQNQNVVVNEINYKSSSSFDCGDWVELYNNGKENVILNHWKLKDDDDTHEFLLPEITLRSESYLVLVNDSLKFRTIFPSVTNMIGNFSFGLSSTEETVRLYNENGTFIDSVNFSSASPWPVEPNGSGATLALINPALDNRLAENWKASLNQGTPGKLNDVFSDVKNEEFKPKTFELFQNYPNPFNPSTIITYQVPEFGKVSLKVYDILGNEVAILVNEEKPAGNYNYELGIRNYEWSSGVYFYQLRVGGFLQTKKMIFLK
ncbi:MAG: CotH kinase family protein [Ignavibacteriaceae bacterium]|nr:CotH kinase family protein [Ignavibacteriaceae bacterium]